MFIDKLRLQSGAPGSRWCGTTALAPPSRRHDRVASTSENLSAALNLAKVCRETLGPLLIIWSLVSHQQPHTALWSCLLRTTAAGRWPPLAFVVWQVARGRECPLAGSMTLHPPPPRYPSPPVLSSNGKYDNFKWALFIWLAMPLKCRGSPCGYAAAYTHATGALRTLHISRLFFNLSCIFFWLCLQKHMMRSRTASCAVQVSEEKLPSKFLYG